MLAKLAATPYQDVAEQVTEFALRAMARHIVCNAAHHRTHDAIHLVLVRCDERSRLSIGLGIPTLVDKDASAFHLRNLEFLSKSRTCHQQHHR